MPRKRRPHQIALDWIFTHIFAPFFAYLLHGLYATLRWDIQGYEHIAPFWEGGKPVIVPCWHGRLLHIPYIWNKVGRGRVFVLMGKNRNGELITRIVSKFNMLAVRGGTTKGGADARAEMIERVKADPATTLALTPDGPRGPRFQSKMGMAHISRTLGMPVVWVTATAKWSVRFTTWDRFMLPLPFSKVSLRFAPPVYPEQCPLPLEGYQEHLDKVGRLHTIATDRALDCLSEEDSRLLDTAPQI